MTSELTEIEQGLSPLTAAAAVQEFSDQLSQACRDQDAHGVNHKKTKATLQRQYNELNEISGA
jgi:hypothetical protein